MSWRCDAVQDQQKGTTMSKHDIECEAFCKKMFELPNPYDGPIGTNVSPPMTDCELEAWAKRANDFLSLVPNRAARVRPKYPEGSSKLFGVGMFTSFA